MSNLIQHTFEGHRVRIQLDENGEPWFVAKDVCDTLEISEYRHALEKLDIDERCVALVHASKRMMAMVNESGLYRLIFRSNKVEAERFRRWVFKEVLPSIRKTGAYSANGTWISARQDGKAIRAQETKIISQFVQYAKDQGSGSADKYYMVFSKLVNEKLLIIDGKKPTNLRDLLNVIQLQSVGVAETIISQVLVEVMQKQMHYKQAYILAKHKLETLSGLIGRTRLGSSEKQCIGLLA